MSEAQRSVGNISQQKTSDSVDDFAEQRPDCAAPTVSHLGR